MFIRKTATRHKSTDEAYFTFRLASSARTGKQVRQITLLNLGRHFDLPRSDWPRLCGRIDALLAGQAGMLAEPEAIEALAQRYAARLIATQPASGRPPVAPEPLASSPAQPQVASPAAIAATPDPVYAEVDVASLQLTRPRSVGVEAAGRAAIGWLGIDPLLTDLGFNRVQRDAVAALLIGRMAAPGSELATWRWLRERSALGELLGADFEAMPPIRLYRTSDRLVRQRDKIEDALFSRLQDLFGLAVTVTLYDLTNTYFEGAATQNPKAARGRSKEKRADCPLVTLGLALDASGFVRRSKMFAGNVAEGTTLTAMLKDLATPPGALVIMDAGIATAANIAWLKAQGYRYLVVSRERTRQFDPDRAVQTLTASNETVRLQRVLSEDSAEVRLYCHSEAREAKETAITGRFVTSFEAGLAKLAEGLGKPRGQKTLAAIQQRIGRLKEKSRGIGQHYEIVVTPDETGKIATAIAWTKAPVEGSKLTHPGVCCLRSNETTWDAQTLWHTYTLLTDLEAVFRGLKSELGLRPVFHHKEDRTEGHLLITVLAYQLVQAIRRKLKAAGENVSWMRLREILSVQQRVTATFQQRDGRTLHVRKTTSAEPALRKIYDTLHIDAAPGGVQKLIVSAA
ncbi:MAG: IS1634 family transposase [Alphaproteobacteria bacterium]|nr:IS1634 family transposase [Alphaproteobacteria bacterium]